jgi:hypothetical protein
MKYVLFLAIDKTAANHKCCQLFLILCDKIILIVPFVILNELKTYCFAKFDNSFLCCQMVFIARMRFASSKVFFSKWQVRFFLQFIWQCFIVYNNEDLEWIEIYRINWFRLGPCHYSGQKNEHFWFVNFIQLAVQCRYGPTGFIDLFGILGYVINYNIAFKQLL